MRYKQGWLAFCRKQLIIIFLLNCFQTATLGQDNSKWEAPFQKCWEVLVNVGLGGDVASDNNSNIIFTENSRTLISLNVENGRENWRTFLGGQSLLNFITDKKSIYSFSAAEVKEDRSVSNIRSLDAATGITNWQLQIYTKGMLSIVQNEEQIFIIDSQGSVNAINKIDGKRTWLKIFASNITSALIFGKNRLLILTNNEFSSLSTTQGEILQKNTVLKELSNFLVLNENQVISGNSTGDIVSFNFTSQKNLWKFRVGGAITSLVKTDAGLLVSSLDNFIYCFAIKNGELKWKKRVAGRINIKPFVTDNYAIILNSNDNIAIIIDVKTGRIINQINISENDYFSGYPFVSNNLLIFRTYQGISAFSSLDCINKKADN